MACGVSTQKTLLASKCKLAHGLHQTRRAHRHRQTLTFDILLSLTYFSGFPSFICDGRKLGGREKLMLLLTNFIMAVAGTHTYVH